MNRSASYPGSQATLTGRTIIVVRLALAGAVALALAYFLLWNLGNYPKPWFDEGAHLQVPKTLVRDGVYAEVSSDGFRYYGATLGVGPTVLLPIAGAFKVFGIGLLQARLLIVAFLLAAIVAYFALARQLGSWRFAAVATALLVTVPSIGLIEYGRQVLGEVPGLFFLLCALLLWFARWRRPSWAQLTLVGVLFGLATVTKYQFLIAIGPALLLSWVLNLVYFRGAPQRAFLVPGLVTIAVFGAWVTFVLTGLGPASWSENLASLRQVTAGAAAVFSAELMQRSLRELISVRTFFFALIPALVYGFTIGFVRRVDGAADADRWRAVAMQRQQWSILFILMVTNLAWYVLASVGWVRYAFLGLAISALFVPRLLADLSADFNVRAALGGLRTAGTRFAAAVGLAAIGLAAIIILASGARLAVTIARAPQNSSVPMATYMNAHVPADALVETWEPQMGFLTDHRYHFPPQLLLNRAVRQIWLSDTGVSELYDFREYEPDYVLVGEFARWVRLYPPERLSAEYELVSQHGYLELYRRK